MDCELFVLCDNPAEGHVRFYAVLGNVPGCRRCARRLDVTLERGLDDFDDTDICGLCGMRRPAANSTACRSCA